MTVAEALQAEFKRFFDEKQANVEWSGWGGTSGENRVLVDDVFNLDELCERLAAAALRASADQ